jgi:phosphomannomutase
MLMRSVSGIRGVIGETLTPDVVVQYVYAFLQITKAQKVVIGRDSRPTGAQLENLVSGICQLGGAHVVSLGIATTPTVELMVQEQNADGGIIITASHNPVEWNALKFIKNDGTFLIEQEINELFAIVDSQQMSWPDYKQAGTLLPAVNGDEYHVQNVLNLPFINVELIRSFGFTVALDAVNGAGYQVLPMLLRELGCTVHSIYTTPDGMFPRGAEPTPENLVDLQKVVQNNQCSVGFALDPDADRCALVSEDGVAIGEEYTLALATEAVLMHTTGNVTINLSTSKMIDDVAAKYNQKVFRSKVGEINVSVLMKANQSIIGGEGNGGVILPASHYGRDSVVAAALVLQWMALHNGKGPGHFVSQNPQYTMRKQKVQLQRKPDASIYNEIAQTQNNNGVIDLQDGIRIDFGTSWVHLRASNTEPIMRIIAEAPTAKEADDLCEMFNSQLSVL